MILLKYIIYSMHMFKGKIKKDSRYDMEDIYLSIKVKLRVLYISSQQKI